MKNWSAMGGGGGGELATGQAIFAKEKDVGKTEKRSQAGCSEGEPHVTQWDPRWIEGLT